MRNAEEKLRSVEDRRSKNPEKYERRNAERLERAKKRCEQIRHIIGSIDPANLSPTTAGTPTPAVDNSIDYSLAVLHPSAETIRLLSNAIAGCLQPCNLINKILNEIIGMVPQPAATEPTSLNDQQMQTEVPPQTSAATNTSDMNTPTIPTNPSSHEIEALFKEAAKELEKMNEIVNNSRSTSLASSMTGITQVERVFNNISDSAISNATIVNNEDSDDMVDASHSSPIHDFNIVSPHKSMRSRESSIEVHDVNSMMSDDSRDWTILDASNDQEDESMADPKPEAPISIAKELKNASANLIAEEKKDSIKSVETQTPPSVLTSSASSSMSQEQANAQIRASIENVGKINDLVKTSIANAQQSLQNIQPPVVVQEAVKISVPVAAAPVAQNPVTEVQVATPIQVAAPSVLAPAPSVWGPVQWVQVPAAAPTQVAPVYQQPPAIPARTIPVQLTSATTPANLMANRLSTGAVPKPTQPAAVVPDPKPSQHAVIVYDPNPKINSAVHQMINMGFSNESK